VVAVPAFVWRGGFARRALTIGATVGIALGAQAWLDSGFLLSGVIVLVVIGVFFGIWMSRRMNRYWPGA
jgi:predicted small integral membrane protein